jgi:hypothetical protein
VDSLLRGWPFGSLLLWSVGNDQVAKMPWRVFARVVDRVDEASEVVAQKHEPATYRMVLDGQQRVQSLLLAFGGDDWGFKLWDKEWHEAINEKSPRGRSGSHWSVGELCLDLERLKVEVERKKKLTAVDFTSGPLGWAVRSTLKCRSTKKRPKNYSDPLPATDASVYSGRFIRLSRLWEVAGDQGLLDSSDFEAAVGSMFAEHKTPAGLATPLQRPVEDLLRKLREVRETRVTFLEVERYDPKMGQEATYMEAVVNIFTRLNTAGRTLTRDEITFAWVKSGWQPEKTGNRSASACFETLRKGLEQVGLELTLDDLMSGIAFVWAVAFNGGKVLSQRDLLDAKAIRPMAQQLCDEWETLERSVLTISEAVHRRGLQYGRHFQSLNAVAVLWGWQYLADRWVRQQGLTELARDSWEKKLAFEVGPLSDRWLIGSQWAGYWGFASFQKVGEIAARLNALMTETDLLADQVKVAEGFTAILAGLVADTTVEAGGYIDRLSVDDRSQVSKYQSALWLWHRMDETRWAMSRIPLRLGKKSPRWDVDHLVAVKLWEKLTPPPADDGDENPEDAGDRMNDIGNCLLLETAFNISKSAKTLAEWLGEVHEFKEGSLTVSDWAAALSLPAELVNPVGCTKAELDTAVDHRAALIRSELKEFIAGKRLRADVQEADSLKRS